MRLVCQSERNLAAHPEQHMTSRSREKTGGEAESFVCRQTKPVLRLGTAKPEGIQQRHIHNPEQLVQTS